MSAVSMSRTRSPQIPWWLILLQGIALVVLGILWLASPSMTTFVAVQFLGIYWLVAGIFGIVGIFLDRSLWGWKLFSGILGILAGIIIIQHPLWSPVIVGSTLIIVLGIQGLFNGVAQIVQAFQGAGWGIGLLGGVNVLFGLILLFNVWLATLALPWVLGVLAVAGGIAAIVLAFRVK
jgi:uncharacterized membrane protein HdeD (DUF308 family)